MRRFVCLLLAFLPAAALADQPVDKVDAQTKICDDMADDAALWAQACTAAIQSGRFTNPARLSELYSNLGFADINLALQTKGDFAKALVDLDQAVRLDPGNASAILNRANAHMYRGEYDASLDDIADVLRLLPDEPKGHGLHCIVLTKMKRAAEGLPECLRAIELGEGGAWPFEDLGAAYEGIGDLHNAELAYRHALQLDANSRDALDGLARVTGSPPV